MYTVKQLSDLAQVSVRTLHYYDEIDLLKPAKVGANGYRYYDETSLLRLQQILFYQEIGLELKQIKVILDSPDFDLVTALRSHRTVLREKIERMQSLIGTVDSTIQHLGGGTKVSSEQLFQGFSPEKQKHYERVARLRWGPDKVNESVKRWNSYTPAQQEAIKREVGQVYRDLADALEAGKSADSEEVQAMLVRWHNQFHYFYEPTLEILNGLAEVYRTDPDFISSFQQFHPDLPDYLAAAIHRYVDDLETAEITRMLAEDEAQRAER